MIINLWPSDEFPGVCDTESDKPVEDLVPHMLWKPVPGSASDDELVTVLVIPGGGYAKRADERAEAIGDWLNSQGMHAAILRYRVGPWRYPAPQMDAARAIRLLRHRAEELGIDSGRVVVLGGSAGGHLAASLALLHEAIPLTQGDDIDEEELDPIYWA